MKLFIFKPDHSKWRYCGGAQIVIAEDWEGAVHILGQEDSSSKYYKHAVDVPEDASYDTWLLVETFPVEDLSPRVVLNDYNWG